MIVLKETKDEEEKNTSRRTVKEMEMGEAGILLEIPPRAQCAIT